MSSNHFSEMLNSEHAVAATFDQQQVFEYIQDSLLQLRDELTIRIND
jgi:hypothetical protein